MKTIEELVGEVKKKLAADTPPQTDAAGHMVSPKSEEKTVTYIKDGKITLGIAKELAAAAEIAAEKMGVKVVAAVCDAGGNLILLHAMDDSYLASVKAAQDKAYTAVALKMPTHAALKESRGGALDGFGNGNGILLLGGGFPLAGANKIYGGIGVSGGTKDEDTLIAAVVSQYFAIRFK